MRANNIQPPMIRLTSAGCYEPQRTGGLQPPSTSVPSLSRQRAASGSKLDPQDQTGFRILGRKDAKDVRLFTRSGYNFADRFPRIVKATMGRRSLTCCATGNTTRAAVLCAFDLIELDGKDLRKQPIEERKHAFANLLYRKRNGIVFQCSLRWGIYKQACALGCEGAVSKRRGSPYRSGRTDHWLKVENPKAPAVKREAEVDRDAKRWMRRT
jgi:bifunctional non-homologous end joining protein LigD